LQNLKPEPHKASRIIGFSFRGPDHLPVTFNPVN
jgi:hypothetical protein